MPEVGKAPPKPSRVDKPDEGDAPAQPAVTVVTSKKAEKQVYALPPELSTKPEIMAYLGQYKIGAKECENLYRTNAERAALDAYCKERAVGRVPDEFFIAALRLWHSGKYPIKKPEGESLHDLAVGE